MAYTTQYIGSRYVPVFADPAEWDSTRTYEPLTIVLNAGNSYTSRQFVPVGIDLTDTDYWFETGNYNAQIESYRQDVLNVIAKLNYGTPEMFGAKGNGITDDTQAIQDAINAYSVVLFTKKYNISRPIDVTSGKTLIGSAGSTILARTRVEHGFVLGANANCLNVKFIGMNFIGNMNVFPDDAYPVRDLGIKTGFSNTGLETCIYANAKSNGPRTSANTYTVGNVSIIDCSFTDIYLLPTLLYGVSNVIFMGNNVTNSLDTGFVDCTYVVVANNNFIKSRDNGVSVSSGCKHVSITGNVSDLACYNGIYCSGWLVDNTLYPGPDDFSITGNTVSNCGHSGIQLKFQVSNGVVSGNAIDTCYLSDKSTTSPSGEAGAAVNVRGYDEKAVNVLVTGNIVRNTYSAPFVAYTADNITFSNNKVSSVNDTSATSSIFNFVSCNNAKVLNNECTVKTDGYYIYGNNSYIHYSQDTIYGAANLFESEHSSILYTDEWILAIGTLVNGSASIPLPSTIQARRGTYLPIAFFIEYSGAWRYGTLPVDTMTDTSRLFLNVSEGFNTVTVYNNTDAMVGTRFMVVLKPIVNLIQIS